MSKRTKIINRRVVKNIIRHRGCANVILDLGCTICSRLAWSNAKSLPIGDIENAIKENTLESILNTLDDIERYKDCEYNDFVLQSIRTIASIYRIPVDMLIGPIPKGMRTVEQQRVIECDKRVAISPHHMSATEK